MQTRIKKPAARLPQNAVAPDDFKSVARRLGADEDKARFEKKLGKIAKLKPADRQKIRGRP
jgi:hypothetical protein